MDDKLVLVIIIGIIVTALTIIALAAFNSRTRFKAWGEGGEFKGGIEIQAESPETTNDDDS